MESDIAEHTEDITYSTCNLKEKKFQKKKLMNFLGNGGALAKNDSVSNWCWIEFTCTSPDIAIHRGKSNEHLVSSYYNFFRACDEM